MGSSLIFGVYVTMIEWLENGTYVMGEAIHNTTIPFENFARVSTWIFFSTIIGWYCVSRIGWKKTAGNKLVGTRMALLQLMLLGFSIITLYEVLYNFNENIFTNSFYLNSYQNWYDLIDSVTDVEVCGQVLYSYFVLHFLIAGFILLLVLIGVVYLTNTYTSNKTVDQSTFKQLSVNSKFFY